MTFIMELGTATSAAGKKDVDITPEIYKEAKAANLSVPHYINQKYPNADPKFGTAFTQICASLGLVRHKDNKFGLVSPRVGDILDGKSMVAGPANTSSSGTPFGTQSRTLFPAAVIQMIEDAIQPDRQTDNSLFRQMVKINVPIAGENFTQPVLSYANAGGANTGANRARAGRITELAQAPTLLTLTTADRLRNIPTYGFSIEMSDKALAATTLDLLTLTVGRFLEIEKDERVYSYLSNIFAGDLDHNTGAVSAVTSTSLDSAATGGVLTHRALLKFLARNRKKRQIDYLVGDIDAYLAYESRTGRPGTNNYDPTLARIDPQTVMMNNTFGGNTKFMLVDSAANGGPVPANTIWALDSDKAIMMVSNTEASYTATEAFAMRRSNAMTMHWSEEAFRLYGDTDLTPFDVLTIS